MQPYIQFLIRLIVFLSSVFFAILPCSAKQIKSFGAAAFPFFSQENGPAGIKAPGPVSTVTIQSTTDCDHCGKNIDLIMVNTSFPDTAYLIHLDSTGHAVHTGVWNGHYNFIFHQFLCSSVILNNIPVLNDTSIAFSTLGAKLPIESPYVNDQSLLASWFKPRSQETYFNEQWTSGSFTTNQWTTSGGSNWTINTGTGYPAPTAMFNWSPQCTNYSQSLTSQYLNSHHAPRTLLNYNVYLNNYGTTTVNNLAVEVWSGMAWHTLKTYDNQWGNIPWTTECLDITNFADIDFRIRFHAYGVDSYDINNWNVDNIKILGHKGTIDPPECFLGENVYLNNVLSAFVNDTGYMIPPQQVVYGQQYQLCATAVYNGGYATPACTTFTCKYLYPPKNLVLTPLECTAHLTWEKPTDSLAQIALIGYNVYPDWYNKHFVSSPDSLSYDYQNLKPGYYQYFVEAKYDLGIYGFPGQTGISHNLRTGWVQVHCGVPMPFHENFEQGNFSFSNWTFEPDQGNWGISNYEKSIAPFADFSWQPARYNYSYAMVSEYIDAYSWPCASLWFDVDYKLVDHNSTGNEKLNIDAWYDNSWHTLKVLSNNGSVDWTTLHLDLSGAAGKSLKIRFVAYGNNSADLLHWYIDNINVYGICAPPSALTALVSGHQAELSWTSPPCVGAKTPTGYNVYRTGPGGVPPFALRNQSLVPGTSYIDDIDPNATYLYYITAVSFDSLMNNPVCESVGSDTAVVSTVTVQEKLNPGPRVYPNPATGSVHVISDVKIEALEILNSRGQVMTFLKKPDALNLILDISAYPSGIYVFRITDQQVTKTVKVIIVH
jgi:hypothetical protein